MFKVIPLHWQEVLNINRVYIARNNLIGLKQTNGQWSRRKKLDILQMYDNPEAMWFSKLGLRVRLWMTRAALVVGGVFAWRASVAGISERTATRGSL